MIFWLWLDTSGARRPPHAGYTSRTISNAGTSSASSRLRVGAWSAQSATVSRLSTPHTTQGRVAAARAARRGAPPRPPRALLFACQPRQTPAEESLFFACPRLRALRRLATRSQTLGKQIPCDSETVSDPRPTCGCPAEQSEGVYQWKCACDLLALAVSRVRVDGADVRESTFCHALRIDLFTQPTSLCDRRT